MTRPGRIALYGNVAIPRLYCSNCNCYAFVIDKEFKCCGEPVTEQPTMSKRMSDCPTGRRGPGIKTQQAILRAQDHRCFYCGCSFGQTVYRHSRPLCLRIQWDHVNPYVYSLDNRSQNFVAACQVCNKIKSSLLFGSLNEARTYIFAKWEEKAYSVLSPVRIELRAETDIADVL